MYIWRNTNCLLLWYVIVSFVFFCWQESLMLFEFLCCCLYLFGAWFDIIVLLLFIANTMLIIHLIGDKVGLARTPSVSFCFDGWLFYAWEQAMSASSIFFSFVIYRHFVVIYTRRFLCFHFLCFKCWFLINID